MSIVIPARHIMTIVSSFHMVRKHIPICPPPYDKYIRIACKYIDCLRASWCTWCGDDDDRYGFWKLDNWIRVKHKTRPAWNTYMICLDAGFERLSRMWQICFCTESLSGIFIGYSTNAERDWASCCIML